MIQVSQMKRTHERCSHQKHLESSCIVYTPFSRPACGARQAVGKLVRQKIDEKCPLVSQKQLQRGTSLDAPHRWGG